MPASAAEVEAARARAVAALELVDEVGLALDLLGLVPDTTCGAPVTGLNQGSPHAALAFAPDGRLAVGTRRGLVHVYALVA